VGHYGSDVINNAICAPADLPIGTHTIKVEVGPLGMVPTDSATDIVYVLEWTTDVTFIATAPGISDLHNVDVTDVTDSGNPLYLGRT
jgi:hypothetical protein